MKSVNCKMNVPDAGKKPKQFRLGDRVSFGLRLSDRGDKMAAENVRLIHNESVDLLLQKAAIENRFSGYLKIVDNKYFVKEWDSYILFPLQLSPWEKPPVETAANEAINFKLINLDKPTHVAAELFSHNYITEYQKAKDHFLNQTETPATVKKISQYAVYLDLFGGKIHSKLPLSAFEKGKVKEGDKIPVLISHFTTNRIVITRPTEKK